MSYTLSPYQQAMVAWGENRNGVRAVLVQAFAGTGKTFSLREMVDHMWEDSVAVFTFSNKAKKDLEEKITRQGAEVRGYNSIGFELCRQFMGPVRVDGERSLRIARLVGGLQTPRDMVSLVAKLAAMGKAMLPGVETRARLAAEGKAATTEAQRVALRAEWQRAPQAEMEAIAAEYDLVPDVQWARDGWDVARVSKLALAAMDLARKAHTLKPGDPFYDADNARCISFDDQCYLPVVNGWVPARYPAVLVDEAQDTNACQLALAFGLLKPGGRFGAVGDRFQSIYRFRGADAHAMENIKERATAVCGGCVELTLPVTYRCGKTIVAEAARLVPGYIAHDSNPTGEVTGASYGYMLAEAGPGDFILSRSNAPLAAACLKLWKRGKRAKVEGKAMGEGLLSVISKLKAKSIPDFLTKLNVYAERECARARAGAKTEEQAEAKVDAVLDRVECLRTMCEGVKGLPELTQRIEALFADDATAEPQTVLMTVHKSKGLEADRVWLLDDTFKAGKKQQASAAAKQDELFVRYVAVTRAKKSLVYVKGLEETGEAHEKAVTVAADSTGETLAQVAAAIAATRQLMEKDPSPELKEALARLEEKHSKLTQARA